MGFLARASALFVGSSRFVSYHQALAVAPEVETKLRSAQADIRDALRAASFYIQKQEDLWQGRFRSFSESARPQIRPRFLTQGSVAYKLLVGACHRPPQQCDLDDGVYFNVEFLDNGEPALVAATLFEFVEAALKPLCDKHGWWFVEKDNCVRVQLDHHCHIDLPLYSAPRSLTEVLGFADAQTRMVKRASRTYDRLPTDKIMLAHRDGGWLPSDPQKMQDWVDACVTRYGEDFRRACRYLKGWRDHRWPRCELSSIALMAAVAIALEKLEGQHRTMSDDRVLYEIAQRLPAILADPIYNPAFPELKLKLNAWEDTDRDAILEGARGLAAEMRTALTGTGDPTLVVDALQRAFGSRLPYRPDAVEIVPTVAATVAAEVAARVPSPQVSRSTSG